MNSFSIVDTENKLNMKKAFAAELLQMCSDKGMTVLEAEETLVMMMDILKSDTKLSSGFIVRDYQNIHKKD